MQRALNTLDPAIAAQNAAIDRITSHTLACFDSLRPLEHQAQIAHKECRGIVADVGELGSSIRQSIDTYEFERPFDFAGPVEKRALQVGDLQKYKVMDERTGSMLPSSVTPRTGPDGRVGEVIFVVHPEFIRISGKTQEKIILAKSTIVVKFDQEVPRRGQGKASTK